MTFTEATTVENLLRDLLCGGVTHPTSALPARPLSPEDRPRC